MTLDIAHLQEWTGRSESRNDQVTPVPVAALAATLDLAGDSPRSGDTLSPLWHWLYFLPISPRAEAGPDGHPRRGGFLPPVPLPRRMWAGGRLTFHQPLKVGDAISRTSRIVSVDGKQGRSGSLVFVMVRHEISNAAGLAITEEHDIVYRDMPAPDAPPPQAVAAPQDAQWRRAIHPDPVLLFRYSALTFNSHLIHYSRDYATEVEGYPGLVVHGPLIATLLLDLLRRELPDAVVSGFNFRAASPLFDTADFQVCGKPSADGKTVELWAQNAAGGLAMSAIAMLA
ncbi:FAS1-like dehydratase domain-containing protein [Noviherbaspirillum sedimenti]|uniref:Acyl-CoA dehydrogenase n=1 Tax=Noviherbaspirillum sedimenti TaxID=2320865 RepID=A0A3A3G5E6_9BURK|nr:MaoC family dehydratase N-terminal domain-containing protein [Noviherbaspirillum sedimenti]RJG02905.1 acyl-CoA dehydrogenase [Noviherbaspirillum sedimenti]